MDTDTDVPEVAEPAYERFSAGFTTEAWDSFFELVADEVGFAWLLTEPGRAAGFARPR